MAIFDQEDDDQNLDYLAELTKPGGKFDRTKYASDLEMHQAIAKGKWEGDKTISFKNKEFDELRETFLDVQAQATAAEKWKELVTQYENRTNTNTNTTNTPDVGNVAPQFDPSKLDEFFEAKLSARDAKLAEKANMDKVDQRLRERFGDNANAIVKDKMNILGLTTEDIKFLAKKSPEAVFNALGLNQPRTEEYQPIPRSNTRSDSFLPTGATIRDAVFYEELRKSKPKEYFSQTTSVQRLKDMEHPDFLKRYNART